MGQDHVHAEAGHQADDALRHGEGLAVGGGVGPCHGNLLALQVLHAAELMDDVEHIGHALSGMIHVALEVYQRGTLLQNPIPIALVQRVHEGFLIFVALADEHIVPDADDVGHEGDHVGGFTDSLAVGNLGPLLVQILRPQTQQVAGGGEGEAGTGGVIPEDGDAQAGIEDPGGLVPLPQIPQGVRHREDGFQLLVRLVPCPVEVGLVHIVDVQALQMPRQFDGLRHNFLSYIMYIY